MATKESLNEDKQQFGDAFAEDAPASAPVSDDEAFGITMPASDELPDDNSGSGEPPASVESAPTSAPAPSAAPAQAEVGEASPAGATDATTELTDDEAAEPAAEAKVELTGGEEDGGGQSNDQDIEKEKQRLRSWEGRLRAQQAAIDANGGKTSEAGETNDDLGAAVAQLTEDFGEDFVNAVKTIAKSVAANEAGEKVGSISKTVEDLIADIADRRARRHFEDIHDAHPDFVEIYDSPEFGAWVNALPGDEKANVERVMSSGSAKEINAVLSQYKASQSGGEKAADAEVDEFGLDDAEGVRSSGIRLPKEPKPANDDFLRAWNES